MKYFALSRLTPAAAIWAPLLLLILVLRCLDCIKIGPWLTLLAVYVALFRDEIARLWSNPPRLKTMIRDYAPDSVRFSDSLYYFRLWITNGGGERAENVQVYAERLRKHAKDEFVDVPSFLPMNLRWSCSPQGPSPPIVFRALNPRTSQHCDLGHICKPAGEQRAQLRLDTEANPSTGSNVLEPGEYELSLRIAASNAPSRLERLIIEFDGEWSSDECTMLNDHIKIRQD